MVSGRNSLLHGIDHVKEIYRIILYFGLKIDAAALSRGHWGLSR